MMRLSVVAMAVCILAASASAQELKYHTNRKYGFTIGYPAGWIVDTDEDGTFKAGNSLDPDEETTTIIVTVAPGNLPELDKTLIDAVVAGIEEELGKGSVTVLDSGSFTLAGRSGYHMWLDIHATPDVSCTEHMGFVSCGNLTYCIVGSWVPAQHPEGKELIKKLFDSLQINPPAAAYRNTGSQSSRYSPWSTRSSRRPFWARGVARIIIYVVVGIVVAVGGAVWRLITGKKKSPRPSTAGVSAAQPFYPADRGSRPPENETLAALDRMADGEDPR